MKGKTKNLIKMVDRMEHWPANLSGLSSKDRKQAVKDIAIGKQAAEEVHRRALSGKDPVAVKFENQQ